eukprot:ANDGO_07116.mRNA.1 Dynein 18 kDa light chain
MTASNEQDEEEQVYEILTPLEIAEARRLFDEHDSDKSGGISIFELKEVFHEMGASVLSAEDIMQLLGEVDATNDAELSWETFLQMQRIYKKRFKGIDIDMDLVAAFVALGGNPDRTGCISNETLIQTVADLGLTIKIEDLVAEIDEDKSGYIDFEEFASMMREVDPHTGAAAQSKPATNPPPPATTASPVPGASPQKKASSSKSATPSRASSAKSTARPKR